MRTIADECEISLASVYRAISQLEAAGAIGVKARTTKSGRTTSHEFTLKIHRVGMSVRAHSQSEKAHSQYEKGFSQPDTLILEQTSEQTVEQTIATGVAGVKPETHPGLLAVPPEVADAMMAKLLKTPSLTDLVLKSQNTPSFEPPHSPIDFHMKAEDLIASLHKCKSPVEARMNWAMSKNKYSSSALSRYWKDLVVCSHPGAFVPEMGMKDKGQFSHMYKKVGEPCADAMEWAVVHWLDFCRAVKDSGLVKAFPNNPHHGFFLKHAQIAVECMVDSEGKAEPSSDDILFEDFKAK